MNNKDLIRQYVDTGLKLPRHQVERLPNNLLQTYLRKRIISIEHDYSIDTEIQEYEFKLMDDKMKDYFISKIPQDELYGAMLVLNSRAANDEFINRVIKIKPLEDIKTNLTSILYHSHGRASIINQMISRFGIDLFDSDTISTLFKKMETPEAKLKLAMLIVDMSNKKLGDEKLTSENMALKQIVYNLDSKSDATFIKYLLVANLKKPNGNVIDDETFFDLIYNLSQSSFTIIGEFMKKWVKLEPNQLEFINQA